MHNPDPGSCKFRNPKYMNSHSKLANFKLVVILQYKMNSHGKFTNFKLVLRIQNNNTILIPMSKLLLNFTIKLHYYFNIPNLSSSIYGTNNNAMENMEM